MISKPTKGMEARIGDEGYRIGKRREERSGERGLKEVGWLIITRVRRSSWED